MTRYTFTTEHAASSYGSPVLVEKGRPVAYGPADRLSNGQLACMWAAEHLPHDEMLRRFLLNLPPDQRPEIDD